MLPISRGCHRGDRGPAFFTEKKAGACALLPLTDSSGPKAQGAALHTPQMHPGGPKVQRGAHTMHTRLRARNLPCPEGLAPGATVERVEIYVPPRVRLPPAHQAGGAPC